MPEIAEAQALLTALAETDEVKADAARRHQLTQLHVSYGNALYAARGHGAPETMEAFAKAREFCLWRKGCAGAVGGRPWPMGLQRPPGRIAIDAGAHAPAFLSDVEARPDLPEAGVRRLSLPESPGFAGE